MSADNETMDRRSASRHPAQHEAHLLFVASLTAAGAEQLTPPALVGQTRDISLTGLSLITGPADVSDYELYEVGCPLKIKLSLPSGVVEMKGQIARREWVNAGRRREHFLLGVSITIMSAKDRSLYADYLRALTSNSA